MYHIIAVVSAANIIMDVTSISTSLQLSRRTLFIVTIVVGVIIIIIIISNITMNINDHVYCIIRAQHKCHRPLHHHQQQDYSKQH